jgi:predicted helicase
MFLSARNSQIDVVQSVGRVMRLSAGKKYGYIIIPVVIPSDKSPEEALDDNKRFKVVWTVLNALRAHDDRFNATINKIELNKKRPANILVGRPDTNFDENGNPVSVGHDGADRALQTQFRMQFEELQGVVFARMVNKVGDRLYWEQWAKSVADIAEKQIARLNNLVEAEDVKATFVEFLSGLQLNINPEITKGQAIEMLSQHMITKPVFEAIFQDYSFAEHNPVSKSMQKMIDLLESRAIDKDTQTLESFYESVKMRASGIDNAEARQRIIIDLYEKFFKNAFPKMAKRLGIVYTPVEVVDFILHSVDDVLKKEFNRCLSDENVHILDPFTGTGTFITRLLQSGLIEKEDLKRKYSKEIHCNEIVLLAYYIATVNVENTFHDLSPDIQEYTSFNGICLTDTFQLSETVEGDLLRPNFFPKNSERVEAQHRTPITVIVSNPPYSAGQTSANDNAQNMSYPKLENRIAKTYAIGTKANNKNSVYDSYIKAFRWSSDRLDKTGGIICFVSNAGWIDGNAMNGFRRCLEKEFDSIYVFNLRGNQRTSGELRRKECGNIFGLGSRAPNAITLLVKNGKGHKKASIFYRDIGDYLNREEKLAIIEEAKTVENNEMNWKILTPNKHSDWINQRKDSFEDNIPLIPEDKFDIATRSFFVTYSLGLKSNRDAWVYNWSRDNLEKNMESMTNCYNEQVSVYQNNLGTYTNFSKVKDNNPKKIKWSGNLDASASKATKAVFSNSHVIVSSYRPFCKQFFYYDKMFNERTYQIPRLFPDSSIENLVICISGIAVTKEFSCLITNDIPNQEIVGKSQCLPLYYFGEKGITEASSSQMRLIERDESKSRDKFQKKDGISDYILQKTQKYYDDSSINKVDIFYYVYGILHSKDYRINFSNELKKMLPRIPLVDTLIDFWSFSKAGRKLADLHINYESVTPYSDAIVEGIENKNFRVLKMRFAQKDQRDTIIFNNTIAVKGIPQKAYEYIVNGKSAIEWVMERYQISTDPDSGITNDPNDWAMETGNPRYILDLLLSIINLSVQTVDIVEGLPKLRFEAPIESEENSKEANNPFF